MNTTNLLLAPGLDSFFETTTTNLKQINFNFGFASLKLHEYK